MLVLNFGHPITDEQMRAIDELAGQPVANVLDLPTQFDPSRPFAEQTVKLVNGVPLTSAEWQGASIVVCPPSLSAIACTVLAELHGRMGYFPPVVRLRSVPEQVPPRFEVAEIIPLQAVRERSRATR